MIPTREELAKQIITYADAIAAFSFVQSVAFGFALAQHEFRESMLKIPHYYIWGIPAAYLIYAIFVVLLCWRYYKLFSVEKKTVEYATVKWLWIGRFAVIGFAVILSGVAIWFTLHGAQASAGKSIVNGAGGPAF
jgi:hypothetical protein